MQNGLPYLDILIFAIIAVFLIFRLKNILGTKTGFEDSSFNKNKTENNIAKVVSIDTKKTTQSNDKENKETLKIKEIDKTFDHIQFIEGSQIFFKMILDAFVEGNLDKVKEFIKPSVLKNFNFAIKERNKESETLIINLKIINKTEIFSSEISKTVLRISVLFESFQIKALKDKDNNLIDGDLNKEILVKDIWVFERKINYSNPNWTLIETKSS
jgi:predicted lipid-binding transport protein (Tim44 family)|tara:strand:- start:58 stop:699 length:642 start_codon:yes stop_codon:yes gene_type:complete